jgi:hypothetical protein
MPLSPCVPLGRACGSKPPPARCGRSRGETGGQIAEQMFLSVKTVGTYRTRVPQKMKLQSNSDLTYYALKNGLIQ